MKSYTHSSKIIKEITENSKGFKAAYYDYLEANKKEIGSAMK